MKLPRRKFLHLTAGVAALPALQRIAVADTYPSRPVQMVVPFPPGSAPDIIDRLAAAGEVDSIDRERPVVFYCRSGSRSAMATEAFRGAGFNAHNMVGGLLEWNAAGLPLEPADGYVA